MSKLPILFMLAFAITLVVCEEPPVDEAPLSLTYEDIKKGLEALDLPALENEYMENVAIKNSLLGGSDGNSGGIFSYVIGKIFQGWTSNVASGAQMTRQVVHKAIS